MESKGTPTLADVLRDIKKISGKDALMEGVHEIDIPRVKCPSMQLNLTFTGGGCPRGRIIELYGQEGGGKSTCALLIAAGFQHGNAIYSALLCIIFLKLPIIKDFIRSDYKHFMTSYFALFIFIGIFNAFNARTERLNILSNIHKNKVFLLVFSFIVIAQIFLIYNGHELFRTYGMTIFELIFVIMMAFTVIPFDFLRKIILKKKGIKIEV